MDCIKCHAHLPDDALYCHLCGKKQTKSKRVRHAKRCASLGSITKLPGRRAKPYWARLPAGYIEYSTVRHSVGCYATYAGADRALREALLKPLQIKALPYTLQDIYDRFIESEYFEQLAVTSQNTHKNAWKNLKACANVPITAVTTETFQNAVNAMKARKLKRETLAKMRNLASLLCKESMSLGLLTVNYGQLVQLPRQDKTPQLPFTGEQLKLLWKAADGADCDAMAVLILCYTGMRPGELLGMRIEQHLHLSDDTPHIQTGSKTDAGRNRIIPIAPLILPFIHTLAAYRITGPLIATPNGKAFNLANWRNRCFKPLMERLGITGRTPYTCRHTFANLQKRRKVDPEIMMEVMGHEDYSTTVEHYHATTDEDVETLYQAFSGMTRPA